MRTKGEAHKTQPPRAARVPGRSLLVLVVVVDALPLQALRVVVLVRGHHRTAGADPKVDPLLQQPGQFLGEAGLLEPVAEVPGVAAAHQDGVRRLDERQPVFLLAASIPSRWWAG